MSIEYEIIIGMEVHVQLAAKAKVFCSCSTEFGAKPNTHTCPVCLGLPGTLPVLNRKVIDYAIAAGLALNCKIAEISRFDRKNYFYPDLPKGYQISQYEMPLCKRGYLEINTGKEIKRIGINRIHIEEDAGKLVHKGSIGASSESFIDYNRSGVPLIEIVSRPDLRCPAESVVYLEELKKTLEYLGVSDCNMEEGSLRCDANLSLRPSGEKELGTKVEIKNINSFSMVKNALEYEVERQTEILKVGSEVIHETRAWNDSLNKTVTMRCKEEAHDYRYFPEPDLLPLKIDRKWVKKIEEKQPELPREKKKRFIEKYNLPVYDVEILTDSRELAEFFEECVSVYNNPKLISNWILGDFLRLLKEKNIEISASCITAKLLAKMLALIDDGTISNRTAKTVFEEIFNTGKDPEIIVEEKALKQISDSDRLEEIINDIIKKNPKAVVDIKNGKNKALDFLIGNVMKETKGRANPHLLRQMIKSNI